MFSDYRSLRFCFIVMVIAAPVTQADIPAGGCDTSGSCGNTANIPDAISQECLDGSWYSFAFPHETLGTTIYSVHMALIGNGGDGDVYLMGDGGGCPDTDNILWVGCCAIDGRVPGYQELTYCTGPIETEDYTWVVVVPRSSHAFEVMFSTDPQGAGHGFLNGSGGNDCEDWIDLVNFISPTGDTYGGCYCVSLSEEPCDEQPVTCGEQQPVECQPNETCDGDVNGDGVVDPLDVGYVLARFGADICVTGNCSADANCDGTIDPLDAGYVLARFGQCLVPSSCLLNCP